MYKFVDLAEYFKKETRDDFYLDLSKVEEIISQSLSKSAYQYSAYWYPSGTHSLPNLILECGFRVIPDLRNKRLRFIREGTTIVKTKVVSDKLKKERRNQKKDNIPEPSVGLVEHYLKKWNGLEDYVSQEEVINRVFRDYSSNKALDNILIKCSILNDFYSTHINKTYLVAKHILCLNIDERLKVGDPLLVHDIAKVKINGKDKYFYSFASKFCSHHNQLEFPIYDSYVHKVLKYYRNVDRFFKFDENDLKVYQKFKNILIKFKKFYKLDKYNFKELDRYLWQFGKEYFRKKY